MNFIYKKAIVIENNNKTDSKSKFTCCTACKYTESAI